MPPFGRHETSSGEKTPSPFPVPILLKGYEKGAAYLYRQGAPCLYSMIEEQRKAGQKDQDLVLKVLS